MSSPAPALATALTSVAATLAGRAAVDPAMASLHARLTGISAVAEPPLAAPFARAVARAADQLVREGSPAATPLLTLLADPAPPAERLRAAAIEELLLGGEPDLARLVELYRRELRPALSATGSEPPPWRHAGPALIRLLGDLLPQQLDDQPRLRRLLPDAEERAALDALRSSWVAPLPPLAEQLGQSIVAAGGANIAHVQQTIVHGDLVTLPSTPTPDLTLLYAHYRAFVAESFSSLDFRGLLQIQSATRLGLDQIYIEVAARPHHADGGGSALHHFVREQPLLVVLGDPGSGKSTLVRYILLALTRGEARARLGLDPVWLPIFFPVAAFAAARARPGHADLAPLAYLSDYYRGLSQPDYGPLFCRALAMGRALILLDGLDEVREDRRAIVHALEAFAREWDAAGNRFIATSRIVGYDEAPLDPGLFATVTIQPLNEDQINCFAERWSRAYVALGASAPPAADDLLSDLVRTAATAEYERHVARHSASLRDSIFAEEHVTTLARNPLLLTILALIHNQGARLPDRRVELYRLCVVALAETWNRARSLSGRPVDVHLGDELLDERFVVNLLGPVALWLHGEQAGGLVDQDDLEQRIAATLEQTDALPRRRALRLARDFVDLMRRETGLLQERGYRRFGFLHLTFEEYLAARGLLESLTVAEPEALLRRCALDPRWREVVRLAVAAAPQREAGRMIQTLLSTPVDGNERARPLLLAGECLLDVGRNGAGGQAWEAGTLALLKLLDDGDLPLASRISAGTLLGRMGDPRALDPATGRTRGVATFPCTDYWCDVAAGPFWVGDEAVRRGRNVSLPRAELPYAFRIARYLVTNVEFQHFIEAGGYHDLRWWSATGRIFISPIGSRTPPDEGGSPITRPGLWDSLQYRGSNQPVVGVSWYEAAAFAAWLTAEGRAAGWLYPGEILRLPTALEWERTARAADQRRYPWGDEAPDSSRANYEGLGLRAASPVGAFPAGAASCGALDMAGNVWEWTSSLVGSTTAQVPCIDLLPNQMPVIKGGAFNWDVDALRCGAYYWFNPSQRHNLLGFRLVWMAAPTEA